MNSAPSPASGPVVDPIARTLTWIEHRLDQPLTLEVIAAHAGFSPHHFSRLFTARIGRSVMAHVRGRRLIRTARHLLDEPQTRIIDLAFDAGFESPEAYARAFKRVFGVSPGQFRNGFSVTPIERQYPMNIPTRVPVQVTEQPARVHLDAFELAGHSRRFDQASKSQIPQLWSKLIGQLPFAGQVESWKTYGVMWSANRAEGSFNYMAAVEVRRGAPLPDGLESMHIPAATYAVFRITLNGGPLHPQVKAAMATIWGERIPAAGMKVADTPDFEVYEGDFAPDRPGAFIDFFVPVES